MSLFDGLPLDPDPAPIAAPVLTPCVITIKRASNGAEILLCSQTPPPASAIKEARSRGIALFTLDEIPAMRRAGGSDPRYIDAIISARIKMGWGGAIQYQEAA